MHDLERRPQGRALVAQPTPVGMAFAVGVLALLVQTLRIGYQRVVIDQHPTQLYDWLISYDGGFVRRGLSGSTLAAVSDLTGVSLPTLAYLLQAGLYVVFAGAVLVLLSGVRLTWSLALLLTAPFLFPFTVLAANAGFRKDILALALLAGTAAAWVRARDESRRATVLVVGVLAFVPVVLVHEFLVVLLPHLAVLAVGLRWTPRRRQVAGVALGMVGLAVVASLVFSGSPAHRTAICDALEERLADPQEDCGTRGAMRWIGADGSEGIALVAGALDRQGPGLVRALPLVVLGLAPAVRETARLTSRTRRRAWLVGTALAVGATLPVFVVALDWGRLVHVHAAATALVVLALRHEAPTPERAARWPGLVLVPYALLWSLGPNIRLFRAGWWQTWFG